MRFLPSKSFLSCLGVSLILGATACSRPAQVVSKTDVTSVDHSAVKRQSIGNCWLYAEASWLEAMLKGANGTEVNVSESYWTWWSWYNELLGQSDSVLQTGGRWDDAVAIIVDHGYVLEGEFLPAEATAEMSDAQLRAQNEIQAAIQEGGALFDPAARTPAALRAALDHAFGSNMAVAETLARRANTVVVGKDSTGKPQTLQDIVAGDAAHRWTEVNFPRVFGQHTAVTQLMQAQRKVLLKRVLTALNAHAPVLMSLMIDFNALDVSDATFKKALVDRVGAGRQGGHMVVLDDYAVDNAPGFGHIGFGEVPDPEKAAALAGEMTELKAKNSWGKDRPERGLKDGYTSFDHDYLYDQLGWKDDGENPASEVSYYATTLETFVLPPGY